jgi:CIC family chloride channel protein
LAKSPYAHHEKSAPVLFYKDRIHIVMEKFDITQSRYLPVWDKDKRAIRFFSKTKFFNKYRKILAGQNDVQEKE